MMFVFFFFFFAFRVLALTFFASLVYFHPFTSLAFIWLSSMFFLTAIYSVMKFMT